LSFDGIVFDTNRGCIVAMYRGFGLGVAHVCQCLAKYDTILAIVEEGSKFGFGS
jgi:hypothetical protein